ncbi:ORF6N domain-containing protein [Sediminibacterium sp. KACHI17]|uniref:ORF6N domain-containing protein n=1 Tax=Sediminibacterium sp. KACHI17 TaxID=1751071 RepID=UPI00336548C2
MRAQKVILDFDLALLYAVQTKYLKKSGRRNIERFPTDFMFELTQQEYHFLRTQFASLENGKGNHSKYPSDFIYIVFCTPIPQMVRPGNRNLK